MTTTPPAFNEHGQRWGYTHAGNGKRRREACAVAFTARELAHNVGEHNGKAGSDKGGSGKDDHFWRARLEGEGVPRVGFGHVRIIGVFAGVT